MFVIVITAAKCQKNPRLIADILKWLHNSISQFEVANIDIYLLTNFAKEQTTCSNQAVRSASIEILVAMRRFLGPGTYSSI